MCVKIHQIQNKTHTGIPSRGLLNVEVRLGKAQAAVAAGAPAGSTLSPLNLVPRHAAAPSHSPPK